MSRAKRTRSAARALVLIVALGALPGCDRVPRLVPAEADSTAASTDSFSIAVDAVRERWDSDGGADGSAVERTAALLVADLERRPGVAPGERVRALLDSLHLGAEVAGEGDVALVNLFALSDATARSWPLLVWRDRAAVRSQAVEGSGMRLTDLALGPPGRAAADSSVQAAGLFARTAGSGTQPLVFVWRRAPRESVWRLHQTLGPDSLGGTGAAEFVTPGRDSVALRSRTWSRAPGFDECPTCPHLYRNHTFHWGAEGFSTADLATEDSPYATFVRFVQALTIPDLELAREQVTDDGLVDLAVERGFGERRAPWRIAPGSSAGRGDEIVFFRGPSEAWTIRFERSYAGARIAAIEPAQRSVE
jgi:hypothetical protein